jgi:hypothetical protein
MSANAPALSPARRQRQAPAIPADLRTEVVQFARLIARKYREQFAADRLMKIRVVRLVKALLPPRPRRGRPRDPMVTKALRLFEKLKRQSPADSPRELWAKVYPAVIPEYEKMPEIERRTAREELHQRCAWRRRKRRPRKKAPDFAIL